MGRLQSDSRTGGLKHQSVFWGSAAVIKIWSYVQRFWHIIFTLKLYPKVIVKSGAVSENVGSFLTSDGLSEYGEVAIKNGKKRTPCITNYNKNPKIKKTHSGKGNKIKWGTKVPKIWVSIHYIVAPKRCMQLGNWHWIAKKMRSKKAILLNKFEECSYSFIHLYTSLFNYVICRVWFNFRFGVWWPHNRKKYSVS